VARDWRLSLTEIQQWIAREAKRSEQTRMGGGDSDSRANGPVFAKAEYGDNTVTSHANRLNVELLDKLAASCLMLRRLHINGTARAYDTNRPSSATSEDRSDGHRLSPA